MLHSKDTPTKCEESLSILQDDTSAVHRLMRRGGCGMSRRKLSFCCKKVTLRRSTRSPSRTMVPWSVQQAWMPLDGHGICARVGLRWCLMDTQIRFWRWTSRRMGGSLAFWKGFFADEAQDTSARRDPAMARSSSGISEP